MNLASVLVYLMVAFRLFQLLHKCIYEASSTSSILPRFIKQDSGRAAATAAAMAQPYRSGPLGQSLQDTLDLLIQVTPATNTLVAKRLLLVCLQEANVSL